MTIEEKVIEFQKTGDPVLGQEILDIAKKMTNTIINKLYSTYQRQDLDMEASDAVVDAIKYYRIGHSTFSSFCSLCIKRRINKFIKNSFKQVGLNYYTEPVHPSVICDYKDAFLSLSKAEKRHIFNKKSPKWSRSKALRKFYQLVTVEDDNS